MLAGPAASGIRIRPGPGAILNADTSLSSTSNPAVQGVVIAVYPTH